MDISDLGIENSPPGEDSPERVYPVALKLAGRRVVVVGGGAVALQKVRTLLPAGARLTVVSPAFAPALRRLAGRAGGVALRRKSFAPSDAAGAFVVVAATDDPALNAAVARAARRHGALVNVVDTPDLCDFFAPSVLRRGDLAIAVATAGESPGLSRRIRLELQRAYGPRFGVYLRWLGRRRRAVMRLTRDPAARKRILARATAPAVLEALRRKGLCAAIRRAEEGLRLSTMAMPIAKTRRTPRRRQG